MKDTILKLLSYTTGIDLDSDELDETFDYNDHIRGMNNILPSSYYIEHEGYDSLNVTYNIKTGLISTYSYKTDHHNGNAFDETYIEDRHISTEIEKAILIKWYKELNRTALDIAREEMLIEMTQGYLNKELTKLKWKTTNNPSLNPL